MLKFNKTDIIDKRVVINMFSEKIKIALIKKNMSTVDLAKLLNVTPQNLYNKFKRDNFSEKEIKEVCEVLNLKYEINLHFENGDIV